MLTFLFKFYIKQFCLQECIPTLLESLTDEELKREARGSENKTDPVSCLIRACKYVSVKTPQHHSLLKCEYKSIINFIFN